MTGMEEISNDRATGALQHQLTLWSDDRQSIMASFWTGYHAHRCAGSIRDTQEIFTETGSLLFDSYTYRYNCRLRREIAC